MADYKSSTQHAVVWFQVNIANNSGAGCASLQYRWTRGDEGTVMKEETDHWFNLPFMHPCRIGHKHSTFHDLADHINSWAIGLASWQGRVVGRIAGDMNRCTRSRLRIPGIRQKNLQRDRPSTNHHPPPRNAPYPLRGETLFEDNGAGCHRSCLLPLLSCNCRGCT